MYLHTYMYLCWCPHVCLHVCLQVCRCVCMSTCVSICVCVFMFMYLGPHVSMCVCLNVCLLCVLTCLWVYMCACVPIYLYACVCVSTYVSTLWGLYVHWHVYTCVSVYPCLLCVYICVYHTGGCVCIDMCLHVCLLYMWLYIHLRVSVLTTAASVTMCVHTQKTNTVASGQVKHFIVGWQHLCACLYLPNYLKEASETSAWGGAPDTYWVFKYLWKTEGGVKNKLLLHSTRTLSPHQGIWQGGEGAALSLHCLSSPLWFHRWRPWCCKVCPTPPSPLGRSPARKSGRRLLTGKGGGLVLSPPLMEAAVKRNQERGRPAQPGCEPPELPHPIACNLKEQ